MGRLADQDFCRGVGFKGDPGDKLVTKSELGNYGCVLKQGSYLDNQCVQEDDIGRAAIGITVTVRGNIMIMNDHFNDRQVRYTIYYGNQRFDLDSSGTETVEASVQLYKGETGNFVRFTGNINRNLIDGPKYGISLSSDVEFFVTVGENGEIVNDKLDFNIISVLGGQHGLMHMFDSTGYEISDSPGDISPNSYEAKKKINISTSKYKDYSFYVEGNLRVTQ